MTLELRDYQREAVEAVEAAELRGVRRVLVVMATGLGKTVCFAELIRRRGPRALVLAHREELLDQAADKLRALAPGLRVGIVQADRDDPDADVVVASVQTLAQLRRLEALGSGFRTVVVDEAHHAVAESYRGILTRLRCFEPGGPLLVGVTATPQRSDQAGLSNVFEELVFELGILEGIAGGWLCDLRAKRILLEADFSQLRVQSGDYAPGQAAELLQDAGAPEAIAEAWAQHAPERKGLVFTPTVELAHRCAEALSAQGVPCEALDGSTPSEERQGILRRLRTGETRAVANCAVLTEGFDEPSIDCIAMARPTRSQALFLQCLGRGTRPWPGKQDCLLLDVVGVTGRHDLVTLASLFGAPLRRLEQGASVTEALEAERLAHQSPGLEGRRVVAVDVELVRRQRAQWICVPGGVYALGTGSGGTLTIEPRSGGFAVVHEERDAGHALVAEAPTLELAFGLAEAWLRRQVDANRVQALVRPDAPWRQRPASERQLAALARWGVSVPRDRWGAAQLTAGEASDRLTASATAARIRRRGPMHELVHGSSR